MEEKKKKGHRYPEKRSIAILKILHEKTDEMHTLKQSEINENLKEKIHRDTLSKVIWQLADELNPDKYEVDSEGRNNDDDFIIKYAGYDKQRVSDSYVNIRKRNIRDRDKNKQGQKDVEQPTAAA